MKKCIKISLWVSSYRYLLKGILFYMIQFRDVNWRLITIDEIAYLIQQESSVFHQKLFVFSHF